MSFGRWWAINERAFDELTEKGDASPLLLFNFILRRVRWNGNRTGLKLGEAFLGQQEAATALGLSRQQIRTALKALISRGFINQVATKKQPRGGTIVYVIDSKHYSRTMPEQEPSSNQETAINPHSHTQTVAKATAANSVIEEPKELVQPTPSSLPSAEIPELEKEAGFLRDALPKGEVGTFIASLRKNEINVTEGNRGMLVRVLKTFSSLAETQEWVKTLYKRACDENERSGKDISAHVIGSFVNHLKQSGVWFK